jgi:ATP-dependent DNA helicase RecG
MPERQNIEFKQSWHDEYLKWVCGFANAIGGVIYFGKDDARKVVHLTDYAKFPFGLTLEELKVEHNSRPRNPKIAKACFMAGYIDTWGRGTLRIINACKEAGLPEPDILEKDGGFMVALHKAAREENQSDPIGGPIGGPMGGPMDSLTERQKEVLQIIKERNKISKRELATLLNINVSAAQAHLETLKDKGFIRREGGTRGFWKIL